MYLANESSIKWFFKDSSESNEENYVKVELEVEKMFGSNRCRFSTLVHALIWDQILSVS